MSSNDNGFYPYRHLPINFLLEKAGLSKSLMDVTIEQCANKIFSSRIQIKEIAKANKVAFEKKLSASGISSLMEDFSRWFYGKYYTTFDIVTDASFIGMNLKKWGDEFHPANSYTTVKKIAKTVDAMRLKLHGFIEVSISNEDRELVLSFMGWHVKTYGINFIYNFHKDVLNLRIDTWTREQTLYKNITEQDRLTLSDYFSSMEFRDDVVFEWLFPPAMPAMTRNEVLELAYLKFQPSANIRDLCISFAGWYYTRNGEDPDFFNIDRWRAAAHRFPEIGKSEITKLIEYGHYVRYLAARLYITDANRPILNPTPDERRQAAVNAFRDRVYESYKAAGYKAAENTTEGVKEMTTEQKNTVETEVQRADREKREVTSLPPHGGTVVLRLEDIPGYVQIPSGYETAKDMDEQELAQVAISAAVELDSDIKNISDHCHSALLSMKHLEVASERIWLIQIAQSITINKVTKFKDTDQLLTQILDTLDLKDENLVGQLLLCRIFNVAFEKVYGMAKLDFPKFPGESFTHYTDRMTNFLRLTFTAYTDKVTRRVKNTPGLRYPGEDTIEFLTRSNFYGTKPGTLPNPSNETNKSLSMLGLSRKTKFATTIDHTTDHSFQGKMVTNALTGNVPEHDFQTFLPRKVWNQPKLGKIKMSTLSGAHINCGDITFKWPYSAVEANFLRKWVENFKERIQKNSTYGKCARTDVDSFILDSVPSPDVMDFFIKPPTPDMKGISFNRATPTALGGSVAKFTQMDKKIDHGKLQAALAEMVKLAEEKGVVVSDPRLNELVNTEKELLAIGIEAWTLEPGVTEDLAMYLKISERIAKLSEEALTWKPRIAKVDMSARTPASEIVVQPMIDPQFTAHAAPKFSRLAAAILKPGEYKEAPLLDFQHGGQIGYSPETCSDFLDTSKGSCNELSMMYNHNFGIDISKLSKTAASEDHLLWGGIDTFDLHNKH
jgi:hypothetical protein